MMRGLDLLYSLPFIFIMILLVAVFGRSLVLIFVTIGLVEWLTTARIVRGRTLVLRSMALIDAARVAGAGSMATIWRHVVPNVLGTVAVYATITVPTAILTETFFSFLGLGIQEPLASWGTLIAQGTPAMATAPWILVFPAAFMITTLVCLCFLGDRLRDALDPRRR
jgi:oligopeptide transport system permease protein